MRALMSHEFDGDDEIKDLKTRDADGSAKVALIDILED